MSLPGYDAWLERPYAEQSDEPEGADEPDWDWIADCKADAKYEREHADG